MHSNFIRELSDDEAPTNEHLNNVNVMFSTPVSSLKVPRNSVLKLKSTRFQLPSSEEKSRKNDDSAELAPPYVHVNRFFFCLPCICGSKNSIYSIYVVCLCSQFFQEPAMSPINSAHIVEGTPKTKQTPFRTPKSVRRVEIASNERILGTPDYLSPELLLS